MSRFREWLDYYDSLGQEYIDANPRKRDKFIFITAFVFGTVFGFLISTFMYIAIYS